MDIKQAINIVFKYAVIPNNSISFIQERPDYYLRYIKKGPVEIMNTSKFILHTNSTFIKDGACIEYAPDIIDLIDYFNLTKEKYHFDILTIDGYIDCFKLFLEYIGTEYEETIESMLFEYQRYLQKDCKGGENND